MKRILTIITVLLITGGSTFAQENMAQDASTWANEWKYAFSKDGVKEWKPEFPVEIQAQPT